MSLLFTYQLLLVTYQKQIHFYVIKIDWKNYRQQIRDTYVCFYCKTYAEWETLYILTQPNVENETVVSFDREIALQHSVMFTLKKKIGGDERT